MPNEPLDEKLSKQLSELTDAIGKLNDRLNGGSAPQANQGAPQPQPSTGSITPRNIWAFVGANLTILVAITGLLWAGLTGVAEKTAKETAKTSTAEYLANDEGIKQLAQEATQLLLAQMKARLSIYRDEELQIVRTLERFQ